ncbi:hypothetical protein LUX01_14795 [Streptomyces sudanensis]|uniref:DUF6571 family protein n=1 Tax=Streptomyces sudanensis TaxID=436397 RepID=UPI0020CD6C52|nr:DUF6571 family protein [Streptomyces sudanensis]MCP9987766.1 hypothetical protein [Streptomyces sudanensis]
MVTWQELRDLRLGKLGTAVTQWEEMVRKLTSLAQGGDGGANAADFAAKAGSADWKGDNATVTKAFTLKTAQQFTDMLTEARSIHSVLRDAHATLAANQRALEDVVRRWHSLSVGWDAQGRARRLITRVSADNSSVRAEVTDEQLRTAERELTTIVEAASEAERIASRALLRHAKSTHDFDETGYRGLRDADRVQGLQDLNAALQLAAKGPQMTDAELRRFNTLIGQHRDNPAFAENLAVRLGAKGTLKFWYELAGGPSQGFGSSPARAKLLADTQMHLSTTLATASHGSSPEMTAWKNGIIAAGETRMGFHGPYGFQVAGVLMRHGTWDARFLNSYGTKLIEFERSRPGNSDLKSLWQLDGARTLDYSDNASKMRSDPMQGLLQALSQNPKASLEFFEGETEDGWGHWEYLVDKSSDIARAWPTDMPGKTPGFTYLGHALEAATLGYPYGALDPQAPEVGTAQQVKEREARLDLMDRVVEYYASSKAIDEQNGIRPSLARMAAGHIDSLNYSVNNFGDSGQAAGRDQLYAKEQHHLQDFGRSESGTFLRALASDSEAYGTVSAAQQIYGTSLMAAHGDSAVSAREAGLKSMYMHGLLDEARFEAIGKEFADDAAKRNLELQKQAAWREYATSAVVGAGVGVGAALVTGTGVGALLIPIAIETVGGAVETHSQTQMMDWLEANKYDNSAEAVKNLDAARQQGESRAVAPLLNWAKAQGMTPSEISDLMQDAEVRYISGQDLPDTDDRRGH